MAAVFHCKMRFPMLNGVNPLEISAATSLSVNPPSGPSTKSALPGVCWSSRVRTRAFELSPSPSQKRYFLSKEEAAVASSLTPPGQSFQFRQVGVIALLRPGGHLSEPGFLAFLGDFSLASIRLPEPYPDAFELHGFFQKPAAADGTSVPYDERRSVYGTLMSNNADGGKSHIFFARFRNRKNTFSTFSVKEADFLIGFYP
jgi:hypothetical protein